jgi:hypothetical protein
MIREIKKKDLNHNQHLRLKKPNEIRLVEDLIDELVSKKKTEKDKTILIC